MTRHFWNTFYSTGYRRYCKSEHFEVTANYSYCHFPKYVVTEVDTGGGRLHWIHFIWQTLDNSKNISVSVSKVFYWKKRRRNETFPGQSWRKEWCKLIKEYMIKISTVFRPGSGTFLPWDNLSWRSCRACPAPPQWSWCDAAATSYPRSAGPSWLQPYDDWRL